MTPEQQTLGEFELILAAALMRLGEGAYGAAILDEIERRAVRKSSVGAIYTTLSRMEKKGLVSSRLGEPTAQRGGRPKRFFSLTAAGLRSFELSVLSLSRMLDGLVSWPTATA